LRISQNRNWYLFEWVRSDIEQPGVNPPRGGFWDSVDCVRLLSTHPNLYDAGIVLDQLPNGFPSQPPQSREIADPIVLFEGSLSLQIYHK